MMDKKKYFEEDYSNCRVKAVRDILLLYDTKIDIHLLYFLSLENVLSLGIVTYGKERLPILTANNYRCDLRVLDNLHIEYEEVTAYDIDDLLERKKALIIYYSADELISTTKIVRTKFCGVSSAVIYEKKGMYYHTTISFDKKYEWINEETLQRVRFAPTVPLSPNGTVVMVDLSKNTEGQFNNDSLMLAVEKNIENLIKNYRGDLTGYDINECCILYYGLRALLGFENELDLFKERLKMSDDLAKSSRLFRVWIRILYRFLDGGDNSESFYRKEITKTIKWYFDKKGRFYEQKWGDELCEKWRKLVGFIGELDKKHGLMTIEHIEDSIRNICYLVRECYLSESEYFEMVKGIYEKHDSE